MDVDKELEAIREAFAEAEAIREAGWGERGKEEMAKASQYGAVINYIGGNCPVQAEGVVDGKPFYFRARGEEWQFHVAETNDQIFDNPIFYIEHDYGEWPDAGWMPKLEAVAFILEALRQFKAHP